MVTLHDGNNFKETLLCFFISFCLEEHEVHSKIESEMEDCTYHLNNTHWTASNHETAALVLMKGIYRFCRVDIIVTDSVHGLPVKIWA